MNSFTQCCLTILAFLALLLFGNTHAAKSDQQHNVTGTAPAHAYVAACVLVKNEHHYIREFIQYHHWLGIDKFYIWDHQSKPSVSYVLEDYVLSSLVEVVYFSDSWRLDEQLHPSMYASSTRAFLSPQGWAYDNCFRMYGYRHTFMFLADPDEYVVIKGPPPPGRSAPHLPTLLKPFETYGGLVVHWQLFGPSGHVRRPKSSTLMSYTQCVPRDALQRWPQFQAIPLGHCKSFTNTRCYNRGCNPHLCDLKPGCNYVNENFKELSNREVLAVHWDRIVINHYVTRSMSEYKSKMSRGSGHSQYLALNQRLGRTHRGWSYFRFINGSSTDVCTAGKQAWELCEAAGKCLVRQSSGFGGGMRRAGLMVGGASRLPDGSSPVAGWSRRQVAMNGSSWTHQGGRGGGRKTES